jgi:hypothetical protein
MPGQLDEEISIRKRTRIEGGRNVILPDDIK